MANCLLFANQPSVGPVRQQQLCRRRAGGFGQFRRPPSSNRVGSASGIVEVALRFESCQEPDPSRKNPCVEHLRDRVLGFKHHAGGEIREAFHHFDLQIRDRCGIDRRGASGARNWRSESRWSIAKIEKRPALSVRPGVVILVSRRREDPMLRGPSCLVSTGARGRNTAASYVRRRTTRLRDS